MDISKHSRTIAFIAAVIMALVALLAFIVSFEAIREYSIKTGAVSETLSWCIPPLLDATILLASLIWLSRSLVGENAFAPKLVLILAATGSLAINVAHGAHGVGAICISLVAPAALVAVTELGMSELRRHAKRAQTVQDEPAAPGAAPAPHPLDLSAHGLDTAPLLASLAAAADEGEVTGGALSRHLAARGVEIPERDARRVLAAFKPKLVEDAIEPEPEEVPDLQLVTE